MPRAKLPESKRAEIIALKHLTQDDIAARTGISKGAVNKVLRSLRAEPQASQSNSKVASAAPTSDDELGDPSKQLNASLRALNRAAEMAAGTKDVARMISVERAIAGVVALAAKLTPPPAPDPNAQPDVVAAAKAFRKRTLEMLDKLLAKT